MKKTQSDSGWVIISENGFTLVTESSKSGAKCDLRVLNQNETEVYHKSFQGFIRNVSLSPDENFVCLITLDYDLILINLKSGKLLFKKPLSLITQPENLEIDPVNEKVIFGFASLGEFAWDFKGNFLDTDTWITAVLEKGKGFTVLNLVTQLFDSYSDLINSQLALKILAALDYCLNHDAELLDQYHVNIKAMLHRQKGQCFEILKQSQKAIASYETALSLNPKAGVQKKLVSLKKANSPQF